MKVIIEKSSPSGNITAPPSKSMAHRLLICAALADGESMISGISDSQDMLATIDCINALGSVARKTGTSVTVSPGGSRSGIYDCRESGSTLRFLIPAALTLSGHAVFKGSQRLMERGISVYEDLLTKKGIIFEKTAESITVSGELKPGDYRIPGNISSQFVSGLLFALPLLSGDSVLHVTGSVESRPYIDMTLDAMKSFGVGIAEKPENTFIIKGGQRYGAGSHSVEGDWSNAAALLAFGSLSGSLTVSGLNSDSLQGDKAVCDILRDLEKSGRTVDISDCPDLGPVLFAVAAAKNGALFTGTRRLKIKESDRASAMAEELKKFGIEVLVSENSVTVARGSLSKPKEDLCSHNDHRIVMALTLLCSLTGGSIAGAEAISKSYPDFFDVLKKSGMEIRYDT